MCSSPGSIIKGFGDCYYGLQARVAHHEICDTGDNPAKKASRWGGLFSLRARPGNLDAVTRRRA